MTSPAEILELIREVGHDLEILKPGDSTPANLEYGIAASAKTVRRAIEGYAVPERNQEEVAVKPNPVSVGNWTAYVLPKSASREDFTPETRIAWDGKTFSVVYLQGIYHRQQVMLHKLRLVQTQDSEPRS